MKRPWLRHWPLVLPAIAMAIAYHAWFGPGLILGEDFQRLSPSQLSTLLPWPSGWDDSMGFGRSLAVFYFSAPIRFAAGLMYHLGIHWPVIERALWLFPFLVLAVVAPYALLYRLTHLPAAAAVGALVFSLNTWTISLTERGHIPSLVSYAIIPLIVMQCLRFFAKPTQMSALGLAALATLQICYDVRYTYISGIAALVVLTHEVWSRGFRRTLIYCAQGVGYLALCATVFNIYWIAPAIAHHVTLDKTYTSLDGFIQISRLTDVLHSLALFYPFYHHVAGSNGFSVDAVEPAFIIIPIAAMLGVAISWKQKWAQIAAVLSIIGVVISSGAELPFGPLNKFLFLHLPGMLMFRDIMKFSALVAFGYAIAIALGAAALFAKLRSRKNNVRLIMGPAATAITICYVILMRDAYSSARFSTFAAYKTPWQDLQLEKFLDERPGFFRTIVYPTPGAYLARSGRHAIAGGSDFPNWPSPDGVLSLLENEYDPLSFYKSPLAWPMLRELGVRYLIVHDDTTGEDFQPYEYGVQRAEALEFFRTRRWLREMIAFKNNVVFEVRAARDIRAFIAPSPSVFEGPPKTLAALAGTEFVHEKMAFFLDDRLAMPQHQRNLARSADGADPASEGMYPLHRRRDFGFIGTAMSASAMSVKSLKVPGESGLAFEFSTSNDENVTLHYVSRLGATRVYAIEPHHIGPVLPGAHTAPASRLYDASTTPLEFREGFEPVEGGDIGLGTWLGVRQGAAVVVVPNSTPHVEIVNITFPAIISTNRYADRVKILVLDESKHLRFSKDALICGAMVRWLCRGASSIRLDHVALQPGRNQIVLMSDNKRPLSVESGQYSLFIRDDVTTTFVGFGEDVPPAVRERPLAIWASPKGDEARLHVVGSIRGAQRSEVALLDGVNIPLFRHPTMCLSMELPNGPLVVRLLIGIKAIHAPVALEYSRIITSPTIRNEELFNTVQSALDSSGTHGTPTDAFADTSFENSSLRRPTEVSDFEITHVYLAVEKPASQTTQRLESTIVVRSGAIYVDEQRIPCGTFIQSNEPAGIKNLPWRTPAPRDPISRIDGTPVASVRTRVVDDQQLSFTETAPILLRSGHHDIDVLAPSRVDFVLLYQGRPHRWTSSDAVNIKELSPSEYAGKLNVHGGFFVWPVTYDRSWSLALVPPAGPLPTGNPVLDAWRTRQYRVSPASHHMANGLINAWLIPRVHGTAVLIYDADVVGQLSAVIWAGLSGLLVVVTLTKARENSRNLSSPGDDQQSACQRRAESASIVD